MPAPLVGTTSDVARLGQPGGERLTIARRGVEPADRAVVGVGDRDRAVGQHGAARAGAAAAPRRPAPSTCPKSKSPAPTSVRDDAVAHPAQRRGLGVGEPQRVAVGARDEPARLREPRVRRARRRRAPRSWCRRTPRPSPVAGSRRSRRCTPAIAIDDRAVEPGDVPRARERDVALAPDVGSPCIHWRAGAGERATSSGRRVDAAQGVVDGVGDHDVVADARRRRRRAGGASPFGSLNRAVAGVAVDEPARRRRRSGAAASRRRRRGGRASGAPASATSSVPSGSTSALPGNDSRPSRGGGRDVGRRRRGAACPWPRARRRARRAARRGRGRGPRRSAARRRSPRGRRP